MSVGWVKLPVMGNMWKDGRVVGAGLVVIALGAVGVGTATAVNSANTPEPTPPAVVETIDFASMPYTNGLAGEQETEAAAVVAEQARVAAEQAAAAEAARVAAEQAAAVEAERVAVEESSDSGSSDEPVDEWAGKTPVPFIADPNPENAAGGFYDTAQCPSGSASTGPDGVPYCD